MWKDNEAKRLHNYDHLRRKSLSDKEDEDDNYSPDDPYDDYSDSDTTGDEEEDSRHGQQEISSSRGVSVSTSGRSRSYHGQRHKRNENNFMQKQDEAMRYRQEAAAAVDRDWSRNRATVPVACNWEEAVEEERRRRADQQTRARQETLEAEAMQAHCEEEERENERRQRAQRQEEEERTDAQRQAHATEADATEGGEGTPTSSELKKKPLGYVRSLLWGAPPPAYSSSSDVPQVDGGNDSEISRRTIAGRSESRRSRSSRREREAVRRDRSLRDRSLRRSHSHRSYDTARTSQSSRSLSANHHQERRERGSRKEKLKLGNDRSRRRHGVAGNSNFEGFPNPYVDTSSYTYVRSCDLMMNGNAVDLLRPTKENSIFDCNMDYLRFQLVTQMYKQNGLDNITQELFRSNACIYAWDISTGDISSAQSGLYLNPQELFQQLTLKIQFNKELKENISLFVFCVGNASFQLNMEGKISTSFTRSIN